VENQGQREAFELPALPRDSRRDTVGTSLSPGHPRVMPVRLCLPIRARLRVFVPDPRRRARIPKSFSNPIVALRGVGRAPVRVAYGGGERSLAGV